MISEILQVFLLAMTPIGELRAAIPMGVAVYGLNWLAVLFVAVIGNLLPVVFLLLFLKPVSEALSKKSKLARKFFDWLFQKTLKKAKYLKEKKSTYWALLAFVAVPLPMTGGWTGALIAFLFGLPFKKAFRAIAGGVALAGIIVCLVVKAGIAIEQLFGWKLLLVAILAVIGLLILARSRASYK